MKTLKLLVPALLAVSWIALPATAQDKPKPAAADKAKAGAETKRANAETRKSIIDNDKVTVVEVTYKPGQASEMRERNPRVTRALTTGDMERTYADGKKEVIHWKAGEVKYSPKETFSNKNVGKTDVVLYVVTLK